MSLRVRAIALITALTAAACTGTVHAAPRGPATPDAFLTDKSQTKPRHPRPNPRTPQPGFVDAVAPPPLVTTGHDYRTILRSLLEYSNWIVGHDVDASLITEVAAPGSPWESGLQQTVATLQRDRLHYVEQYDGPSTITLVSTLADVVSARYVQPITLEAFLDAHGNVRREVQPPNPTTSYVAVMVRLPDGRWRLASVDER